jgi:hypothetical protein
MSTSFNWRQHSVGDAGPVALGGRAAEGRRFNETIKTPGMTALPAVTR